MTKATKATAVLTELLRAAGVSVERHAGEIQQLVDLLIDAAVEEARNERKGIANQRKQPKRKGAQP